MALLAVALMVALNSPVVLTARAMRCACGRASTRERVGAGIGPLVLDARLSRLAREQVADLASRGAVSHLSRQGLDPFDRMRRANVRFGYAGENVALGGDVAAADRALWQSEPHRRNTLEPHYARIGIAAVATPRGEFFVEDFSD